MHLEDYIFFLPVVYFLITVIAYFYTRKRF